MAMRSILRVMRTCIEQTQDVQELFDGDWGVAEGLVFENFEVKEFDWVKKLKEKQVVAHGSDFGSLKILQHLSVLLLIYRIKSCGYTMSIIKEACLPTRYIKCI